MYAAPKADQHHNSSIDLEGDSHLELARISEDMLEDLEERNRSQRSSGSETPKHHHPKKKLEDRRNNLLDFSPSKNHHEARNKSSNRKLSNSARHPMNLLKALYAEIEYEDFEITGHDDYIMIGSNKLKKPFVEKPFDAENH